VRYLLDTQIFLWMQTSPGRIGAEALAMIQDGDNELLLSAASSWEIAIKYSLGKLPLPDAPADYVPERMATSGVAGLRIEHTHALAVAALDDHHRDPFDRMLIAQAIVEGIPIITSDRQLAVYDVELIAA
jgi:PIN domain nuclease of toxin-antitoxin system